MKKIFALLIALLLCVASTAALADALAVAGLDDRTITHEVNERIDTVKPLWYDTWRELYPKVSFKVSPELPYRTTGKLLEGLRSRNVKQSVLALSPVTSPWTRSWPLAAWRTSRQTRRPLPSRRPCTRSSPMQCGTTADCMAFPTA